MRRGLAGILVLVASAPVAAQEFRYEPPGALVAGSGQGRADDRAYVPDMRFPIEVAPAFANSQVWGRGGSQGGGGGQCDAVNYSYPWRDNYCESRQWNMPLCPSGTGHQGQDIRPSTCENRRHWAVAAEDGTITSIGSYSVSLTTASGTRHRYLHMDPNQLAVRQGQAVRRGDRLGLVSNAFDGTPTTIHLHYDIQQSVNGSVVYVPTYMSLVRSYETLIGGAGMPPAPCAEIGPGGGILDDGGPCFELFGPPATWRSAAQGTGGGLRWTYAWVNATPGNWARWRLHFTEAGRFRVAIHKVAGFTPSLQAPFKVRAGGREVAERLDFSQAGEWLTLGTYDFAAGGDQWVVVEDNSGEDRALERQIVADSIRLERIDAQAPEPQPEPAPPEPDPVPEAQPEPAPRPEPEPQPTPQPVAQPEPEAPQPEAPQPEASQPEAPQPEAPQPEPVPEALEPEFRPEAGLEPEAMPAVRQPDREDGAHFAGGCAQAPRGGKAPGALALLLIAALRRRRRGNPPRTQSRRG